MGSSININFSYQDLWATYDAVEISPSITYNQACPGCTLSYRTTRFTSKLHKWDILWFTKKPFYPILLGVMREISIYIIMCATEWHILSKVYPIGYFHNLIPFNLTDVMYILLQSSYSPVYYLNWKLYNCWTPSALVGS